VFGEHVIKVLIEQTTEERLLKFSVLDVKSREVLSVTECHAKNSVVVTVFWLGMTTT